MKMNPQLALSYRSRAIVSLVWLAFCIAGARPARAASETESDLRDFDAKWSDAAAAKDVDKTVSFYSDDALVLPSNAAAAHTKESIRAIWKEMLEGPGQKISWKAIKVEVAKSGELGYVSGTYEMQMNDASGKPLSDRGKYLEILKKQPDGNWKCTVDIWNSDLPPAPPAEGK